MLAIPLQHTTQIDFNSSLKPFISQLKSASNRPAPGVSNDNSSATNNISDSLIDEDIEYLNDIRRNAVNAIDANEISCTHILRLSFHYKNLLQRIHNYELSSTISISYTWNDAFSSRYCFD
jgi:hypothetical protein